MRKFVLSLAVTIFVFSVGMSFAGNNTQAQTKAKRCKWAQIGCPGGGIIEGCLTIGDGNSCSCGNVTRDCGDAK